MNKHYFLSRLKRPTLSAIVPADRILLLKAREFPLDYNIVSSAKRAAASASPGRIIIAKAAKSIKPVTLKFIKK